MDSMRNLSTSLPGRRRADGSELLTDFRAAALSVTNLYKSAAAAQAKSRAAGYQDALDDLLAFLDKENLGLMDGEGWKVRRWATEHLDDGIQKQVGSDDDDEVKETMGRPESRSSSPDVQRKPTAPAAASSDIVEETTIHHRPRVATESPAPRQPRAQTPQRTQATHIIPREDFTFRSNHVYPSNHDREGTMDLDTTSNSTAGSTTTSTSTPNNPDTVRIVSRAARNRHAHSHNHNRQRDNRTLNLNLGSGGAGSKRKIPYPDFFDISGVNFGEGHERKDGGPGGRGGKRGRHA